MKNLKKDNKGFSLVELLVVIAIMVVLVGVVAPTLLGNIEKARVSADIQSLDNVAAAIQVAIGDEKAYYEVISHKDTPYLVSDYVKSGSGSVLTNLKAVLADNIAAAPTMKGTTAKTNQANMYFSVSETGQVTVWLGTKAWVAGTDAIPTEASHSNVVNAKNTDYLVIR